MRIVDLFSGAGGLTFGFYYKLVKNQFVRNLDNEFIFANEIDNAASQAFKINFPDIKLVNDDIKALDENTIRNLIGNEEVDLIIGGPPCQSFSLVGKRRYDDRARLYNEYYRLLSLIRPRMFLFENVKGMLSMKDENGQAIIDDLQKKFANISNDLAYNIHHAVLNAVDFGVPQHRERVFFIGIRADLALDWNFPVAFSRHITIKEAISDLPPVNSGEEVTCYTMEPMNEFQKLMRNNSRELSCHFCALYGEKIQTVINHVPQGEGRYYINNLVDRGILDEKFRLTSGYKNTYSRLIENQPCPTITHNMSTPSGLRCIHYEQNRALTPREGARIQSFPDWFQFYGNKSDIKSQIGNAVPPLLSIVLANVIEHVLRR